LNNSACAIVSKGMDELAQVSPELKQKNPEIDWKHIEMMRDPLMIRNGMIEHPSWVRKEMRDEIPAAIEKVKRILDE